MRVAISVAEHEVEMADRWFSWVCELGGTDGHSLHLIPVSGLDISVLLPKANQAFGGRVLVQKDEEGETSDWQAKDLVRSASGPNSAFRQVAWDTYMNKRGPYFWCELDCIPLRKDWLDRLESEYASCGKPFMGSKVEIQDVPPHMSGNAVYPTNVPELAPMIVQRLHWVPKGQSQRFELAFDVAGAKDVLPKAHFTKLIQHIFRHKGFQSRSEFDATIDPNAVVFHSCKDGSIFKYLRENLSGVPVLAESGSRGQNPDTSGARESTKTGIDTLSVSNSRGAAQNSCPANPIQLDPHPPTSGSPSVVSRTFTPKNELEAVIAQNSVIKNGLPAMSPPWENREDSEKDVKMLCDALSLFCKAPIYKSRVRNALREAKIIK